MHTASSVLVILGDRYPALLNIQETADAVGMSFSTVRKWTYNQVKPPQGWPEPKKVNRATRYRKADLEAWLTNLGNDDIAILAPAATGRRRLGSEQ